MFYKSLSILIVLNFVFTQLFFSEYAEGSSNNKYLEIYNNGSETISLENYAFPNATNGADEEGTYDYWNAFDSGATIAPGDVFVLCHPSSDASILSECDQTHTYMSNGDDGFCLVYGTENDFSILDCVGDWSSEDPGFGWAVAGVTDATKDHTLVRKIDITEGNAGDWSSSAGTNADDSEWVVLDINTWVFLGSHPHEDFSGGTTGGSTDIEDCDNGVDDDGDGFIDCDDFDCNCGSEICDNGVDDDGDTYIDCNDFDCSSDPACDSGGSGSCAEYGCVGFTPSNACQCNDLCSQYNNCCDDYEDVCGGSGDGGSTGTEDCTNGIDDDGDGYVDCDDWNCDGTTGDADPACGGGSDGGNSDCSSELGNLFFSEYAEGSSNNKYLEIYNNTADTIDLCGYAYANATNGADQEGTYDYWNTFNSGSSIASGDVFVLCHPSSDASILSECDQTHTYLSNGDDGFCLVYGTENNFSILDCVGDWSSEDPGLGWDVAGVSEATKDHTLVRQSFITTGNTGNWAASAGVDAQTSEWIVYDNNTWDYVGSHNINDGPIAGCTDPNAYNYNQFATQDNGTCTYAEELTISQIQGFVDDSPYVDSPVNTMGVVTGINEQGFYMQDGDGAWNGIWVYAGNISVDSSLALGDNVTVQGVVKEYYGLTEVEAVSVVINSSGNVLPNPSEISTGDFDEAYEGVRVKFSLATCTALPNSYGEWIVNDGSGEIYIDDKLSVYNPDLQQSYDIVGIGDYNYNYKVQATDVSVASQPLYPVAIAGDDQQVEYGDVVTLDGSSSFTETGIILGYLWDQVSGIAVDLGDYENDVVTFTAPNEFTILTFTLEVINNFGNSHVDYVTVQVGELGIYDIQYTSDQGSGEDCYPSEFLGSSVNVTGVVTAVKTSSKPTFYIQDPNINEWSGVFVYFQDEMDPLAIGDLVNLDAIVEEYYGFTEIKNPTNINVLSQNNSLAPIVLNTGDIGLTCSESAEKYEGMFVKFENAVVETVETVPIDYDNDGVVDFYDTSYFINDNSGTAKLNDYMFNYYDDCGWPTLSVGDQLGFVEGVIGYSGCSTCESQFVMYPADRSSFSGLNPCAVEVCNDGVDNDGDSYIDCNDFDCNDDVVCGGSGVEICNDGIDNDGDSYIDCDDYGCDDDPACGGSGSGSCAEYGCGTFNLDNPCQCDSQCSQYNNCCNDYDDVCDGDDGGSTDVEDCDNGVDDDGDGYVDCDDFDCNCGSEICDDGIDNDGDSYIDCDDFNCSSDPACGGSGTGSCAEYGCVEYTPSNTCQCNALCSQYNNCCDDYEDVCGGGDDGGSTDTEDCTNGVDDDGDGYIDCEDWNCDGTIGDADPACGGSDDGGSSDCASEYHDLFFSEYAEGSSNNKYLEIYNNSNETIDLCGYAYPNATNGADIDGTYDYWNTFDSNTSIAPGDVFVLCHPSSDDLILAECDQTHTYLSNGDDGFCLVYGEESDFEILDCIGTWSEEDPGSGWDVAGVSEATKDHTLVRKSSVTGGNDGDWSLSAGTDAENSEWIVLEQNDWTNIGMHDGESSATCNVGDVSNDGVVNVVDIVTVVGFVLGTASPTDQETCAADTNNDGLINVVDIVSIVNIILN